MIRHFCSEDSCFYAKSNANFYSSSSFSENVLFNPADQYENSLTSDWFCVVNHTPGNCPLSGPHYHLYSMKKGKKELSHKMNNIQINYQFVDCLCKVFEFRFNGSVYGTEGQCSDLLEEDIKFKPLFQRVEGKAGVSIQTIEKTFGGGATFTLKEGKPWESKSDRFPERIAIVIEKKHQTDFLKTIDNLLECIIEN